MTREEAIEILKNWIETYPDDFYEPNKENIKGILKVLKQPEIIYCKDCKYYNNNTEYCQKHNKWYCMCDNTVKPQKHYCSYAERRDNMKDFKQLYIEMLKQYDENICKKCVNYKECLGKKCECYETYDKVYDMKGNEYNYSGTCEDFDYGTCRFLESTPCNGCFDNDFSGFNLKEEG